MDQLRRVLATIRKHLGDLGPTHKMLIGSVVVIMVMALFLVVQYAAAPKMVELLPGADQATIQRASTFLDEKGIPYEPKDGGLFVPVAQASYARGQLGQNGRLPDDTSLLFSNLIEKQNWTMSKGQLDQAANIALQNELARCIASFDGIARATVFLEVPPIGGLGQSVRQPTAVASVATTSGGALNQSMVDAVANLVAGAKAGLKVENVRVVDMVSGTQHRARTEDDLAATTYRELARGYEQDYRRKVMDLVSYIPGVVVAVTAHVDARQSSVQTSKVLGKGEGSEVFPLSERTTERQQSSATRPAEPGVFSNQPLSINEGTSGSGSSTTETDTEAEFQPTPGTQRQDVVDPRGYPIEIAVSVNVPEKYVASLLTSSGAGQDSEPSSEAIATRFADLKQTIEDGIRPLVKVPARDGEGEVTGEVAVSMIPGGVIEQIGIPRSGGAVSQAMLAVGGPVFQNVLLGCLAVAAMATMVLLVRRAGRRPELPSASEIVGIPPALGAQSEIVGEADESETAIAGIEVGDEQIRSQKLLEQVRELIKQNPDTGATLINRWITTDR